MEYDLDLLKNDDIDCWKLKEQMLKKISELAVEFYRAMLRSVDVSEDMVIFYKVLEVVTYSMEKEDLGSILAEIREKKQEGER